MIEKIVKLFLASDLTSDLVGEIFRALHMRSAHDPVGHQVP
jgi:hypothetical protein